VNFTDGQTHQLAVYCLDWDLGGRTETIDVLDAVSNAVLDSRSVSAFTNGQYLIWNLSGHVKLKVTPTMGTNAVIGGLFFGATGSSTPTHTPPPSPSGAATFVNLDTVTKGNWKGVYGADGYNVINDTVSYPAYAQITPTNQNAYTWTGSTSDVR